MSGDVALTASLRQNLQSLQNTSDLIDRTSNRLSTGKEVNSVFDDPVNFAKSQGFSDRAGDLDRVLDNISQSKRTVEQAQNGANAIEKLVEEAESLINQAEEELNQGDGRASVAGSRDLSSIDNTQNVFTDTNNDTELELGIVDEDGNDQTRSITLNDSAMTIDQLVAKINAESGVEAELDESGKLRIEATNEDSPLRISFNTGTAGDGLTEQEIANELGLQDFVRSENDGMGGTELAGTTTSGTTLTSVQLIKNGSTDTAEASDTLAGLRDMENQNVVIDGTDGDNDTVQFQVKDKNGGQLGASEAIDLGNGSIQDVVDGINNSEAGEFVRANFNGDTGELKITAIDQNVDGVVTEVTDNGGNGDAEFNAGFDSFDGEGFARGGPNMNMTADQFLRFGASAGRLGEIESSFDRLRGQLDSAVKEAELSGTNLLNGDDLETFFNTERTETLLTEGVNFTSDGLGIEEANFTSEEQLQDFRTSVIDAKEEVRGFSARITTDLNVIQTREDFANKTQETLNSAADDLTLADQNEEAAKLSALQTRQQLANQSLSISVQSQQSVLQLLQ